MTTWGTALHTDNNGIKTAASYGDRGDATDDWFQYLKVVAGGIADGGVVSIGLKADAAVTNPASAASVIALLKGILTNLGGTSGAYVKAEDAASASGDLLVPMGSIYRATPVQDAGTVGDYAPLHTDDYGRLMTAENSALASNATSTAYEASRVVKASPGRVWGLQGYNSLASAQFVMLFNSTTVPADGVAGVVIIPVAASSGFSVDFGPKGRYFSTGIAIANSTTSPTKTLGAADCFYDVQYE